MTAVGLTAALLAIVSTAVIYGTDVFSALVLRPAAARAADASVADLLGRVHHFGDRRLPVPGAIAVLAATVATATSSGTAARTGAGIALAALLAWLAIYRGISAPVNRRLRAAAADNVVPTDTRALQQRWDSVIWPRAALQTTALAGLLLTIVAS